MSLRSKVSPSYSNRSSLARTKTEYIHFFLSIGLLPFCLFIRATSLIIVIHLCNQVHLQMGFRPRGPSAVVIAKTLSACIKQQLLQSAGPPSRLWYRYRLVATSPLVYSTRTCIDRAAKKIFWLFALADRRCVKGTLILRFVVASAQLSPNQKASIRLDLNYLGSLHFYF